MLHLIPTAKDNTSPVLLASSVYLRAGEKQDYEQWATLREQSRQHLTKWEEDWKPEEISNAAYIRRMRFYEREARRASGLALFVFLPGSETAPERMVGGVTLTNIRYGASRSGVLGYWIGEPYLRQGYAKMAIKELLAHAISSMGLNRVEAACQPENTGSLALLQKLGFRREGCAADYLKINGEWRDHVLFAVTAREYKAS
ncbi:MAG: GCN5 family N-acetyltransferase [Hyphococcus sp.]|nr:MAG: GCN5 family N-acetyltransferase [Marinicaulis sp.]